MTVGDRKSWFPSWLHRTPLLLHASFCMLIDVLYDRIISYTERITSSGIAFISADYRLIPPCTGHDVLRDIEDLFTFLSASLNTRLLSLEPNHNHPSNRNVFKIDPERIGVAGSSAGGLCAYLAAAHAFPRPKVVLSMYGMGGDFLVCPIPSTPLSPFLLLSSFDLSPTPHRRRTTSSPKPALSSAVAKFFLPPHSPISSILGLPIYLNSLDRRSSITEKESPKSTRGDIRRTLECS